MKINLSSVKLSKRFSLKSANSVYLYAVENVQPNANILIELVQTPMPYGKYKGTLISDLPVHYLEWMHSKGMPPGKIGMLLATAFEIKTNGLTEILFKVKQSLRR
jgi:uncharacterized protein (DUF3820 family)